MTQHQHPLLDPLTEREMDVLRHMARGLTTRQIARQLFISVETVRWYTKQIYSKMGVHSRTQASLRARDLGLISASPGGRPSPPAHPVTPAFPVRPALPIYATPFVGRDQEVRDIDALLREPTVRLVTVAGPGGMGKTRLCAEVARRQGDYFADGVVFVPLAALTGVDEITTAVARALQLHLKVDESPDTQLRRYLSERRLLLVLDNVEHLTSVAAWVARLLETTHRLKILTTSHASINVSAEWVRYLEGIPFPSQDAKTDVATFGAVQLFVDRARRVRQDFSLAQNQDCVVEICRMVRGMPLALELAASWVKVMICRQIAAEIRHNIDFLAARQQDIDARHRSLRAVFDYSWHMLSDAERRLLRRLSVFRGEFGLDVARQVAGATPAALSTLVDRSFLTLDAAGTYEMHPLLRQYAEERLENQLPGMLTTRSSMLLTWSSLVKGNFDRSAELAEGILARSSDRTDPTEEAFGLALLGVLAGMEEDYGRCRQLCDASLALSHKVSNGHDLITAVFAELGLAVAGCGEQEYYEARCNISQALHHATAIQSPAFITLCLPVVAVVLAHAAEAEQATAVLALAFTHRASTPTWMEKWPLLLRLRADLQADLGREAYATIWAEGQTRSLRAVTDELLQQLG